ncbi:CheC, inhibitor of MCP methylation [Magnetococcus marinus MC-1]|uniref:CheC, inhibitor of MCP methylation n=2 Tax=Magnetococcus TaxID=162171 RepID=A0LDG9_MAGMM|nr:CheC, inhibitor of MCP methylation [Magnetococcus marinus MC-1]
MFTLSELEEDALKEFFNMGLGKAANSLSEMVHNEVLLSLPLLKVVPYEQATRMLVADQDDKLVAVRQNFYGDLSGTALLIFPGANSLELVRTLLSEEMPLDVLTELEQETLQDVGNVIINAFLESFTQMMTLELEFEAAEFLKGSSRFLLDLSSHLTAQQQILMAHSGGNEEPVFVLMMDFKTGDDTLTQHTLSGFVVLLFTSQAMRRLRRELDRILSAL